VERGQAKPIILIGTQDIDLLQLLDRILQPAEMATSVTRAGVWCLVAEQGPDAVVLDCRDHSSPTALFAPATLHDGRAARIPLIVLVDACNDRWWTEVMTAGVERGFKRPIPPGPLLERLRGLLASVPSRRSGGPKTMQYADVSMDPDSLRVWRDGRNIHLSPIEFRMLQCFLERPEQVISREELHEAAWRENVHVGPRTIDVHISHLRRVLCGGSAQDLIRTIRAKGYALCRQGADAGQIAEPRSASRRNTGPSAPAASLRVHSRRSAQSG
jgi:two-component system, OmpR family, phosphate regulon response regulator PhoB